MRLTRILISPALVLLLGCVEEAEPRTTPDAGVTLQSICCDDGRTPSATQICSADACVTTPCGSAQCNGICVRSAGGADAGRPSAIERCVPAPDDCVLTDCSSGECCEIDSCAYALCGWQQCYPGLSVEGRHVSCVSP